MRKTEGLEESFWISLRLLEEKNNVLILVAEKSKNKKSDEADSYQERIKEIEVHINRIREFLFQKKNGKEMGILE
jgi:two-component system chemotaxis response regulator CheB